MKQWLTWLACAGFVWGCASVSESPVPVMGVGEKQKEAESKVAAAESAPAIPAADAVDDSVNALAQALLFMPFSCLLYTSPSPRDGLLSRMPSSA